MTNMGRQALCSHFRHWARELRHTEAQRPIFVPCGARKRAKNKRFAPFWHFCSHFLEIEGHGEEGKIHGDLVFAKMAESLVLHVVLYLPEYRLRFNRALRPVFEPLLCRNWTCKKSKKTIRASEKMSNFA